MSWLEGITSGQVAAPLKLVIHGPPKVGKTTWAASAPGALVLQLEEGANEIAATRSPLLTTWGQVQQAMDDVSRPHPRLSWVRTLVVDSLSALEALIWAWVVEEDKAKTIEDVGKGYGKGYSRALDHWRWFLRLCDGVRARGVHVVLVAHSQVETVKDPTTDDYDRWRLKLQDSPRTSAAAAVMEWASDVVFANWEAPQKVGGKWSKRARMSGTRWLYTQPSASYVAGCRHALPPRLPLDFAAFWSALEKATAPALDAELVEACREGLEVLHDDPARVHTLLERAKKKGNDGLRLCLNWVQSQLDEREEQVEEPDEDGPDLSAPDEQIECGGGAFVDDDTPPAQAPARRRPSLPRPA